MKPKQLCISLKLGVVLALLSGTTARAVDFHVATPQDLQNALSLAAENGANNTIYLSAGYYAGNFNFNSSGGLNLTVESEPGLTNTDVTLDGSGGGRALNISGAGDVTVSNLTFIRNCGNYQIGSLRIGATGSGNILVEGCRFLSRTNTSGRGLEISSGFNTTIRDCIAVGKNPAASQAPEDGSGIDINGVTGSTLIYNCLIADNYKDSGANIDTGSTLTLSNDVFQGNSSYGLFINAGGARGTLAANTFSGNGNYGVYWDNNVGTFNVNGNVFSGNLAGVVVISQGGGTVTVTGNTFDKNWQYGGAFLQNLTMVTVAENDFNGNINYYNGGGGASFESCQNLAASQNTFEGNAGAGGYTTAGGVDVKNGQSILLSGNTFVGNSGNGSAGGVAYGGGASVTIANNDFNDNRANAEGNKGDGGGLAVSESGSGSLTLTNNTFEGNSASYHGGGAYLTGGTLNIVNNVFRQNSASQYEGAITAQGSTITISDNLVVNNTAGQGDGGIWANPSSTLDMINNTVCGNSTAGRSGGVNFYITGTTEVLNVFNNIIWGNLANGSGADVYLTGTGQEKQFLDNDADGMYGVWDITQHVLDVDPQFFDPVNGDYHLQGTSPCANAGTNGAPGMPLVDLDGNSRTNSAGQVDLGCYEFNTTATHPADTNSDFVITPAEFNAYATAWKNGQAWTNGPSPITADYLTRAGYLMTNGTAYHNDGSQRPTNWKPGP